MAFNLGGLMFKMSADVASLKSDMSEAKGAVSGAANAIESSVNFAKAALVSLGAAFSIQAVAGFVKSSIDAADATNKMAQAAGVSVESLSALQYAASFADISNEDLSKSLAKLSRTTRDAADGGKAQKETFDALGISVVDVAGRVRSADQVMIDIAARFSEMGDGAKKTAIAQDLFGRSGAALIPLLNGGADGLRQMTEEAERLGLVLSTQSAQQAEAFNDGITKLQKNSQSLSQSLAVELLPELNRIIDAMNSAAQESGVLSALWVGLGGIAAESLNIDPEPIEKIDEKLQQLNKQLDAQKSLAEDGGPWKWLADFDDDGTLRNRITDTERRIASLLEYRDKLQSGPEKPQSFSLEVPKFDFTDVANEQGRVVAGYIDIIKESERARESAQRAIESLSEQLELMGAQSYVLAEEGFRAYQDQQDQKLQTVRDSLLTEEEAIEESYARKREIILGAEFAIEEERQQMLERAENERASKTIAVQQQAAAKRASEEQRGMSAQERLWKSGLNGRLQVTAGILGQIGTLMYSENRKMFEIGKVAAIGEATIKGYVAIQNALAVPPYPLGVALAATAAVATAANISAIQSQSFGGGGGGSPTYSAGPGGFPTSSAGAISSDGPTLSQQTQTTPTGPTIIIQGDLHSNDAERLMSDIKTLINDSDFVLIESTSRQAQTLRA